MAFGPCREGLTKGLGDFGLTSSCLADCKIPCKIVQTTRPFTTFRKEQPSFQKRGKSLRKPCKDGNDVKRRRLGCTKISYSQPSCTEKALQRACNQKLATGIIVSITGLPAAFI